VSPNCLLLSLHTGSSSAATAEREHLTKFFIYISIYFQQILFRLIPFFPLVSSNFFSEHPERLQSRQKNADKI
jgi:hypothetical protein